MYIKNRNLDNNTTYSGNQIIYLEVSQYLYIGITNSN